MELQLSPLIALRLSERVRWDYIGGSVLLSLQIGYHIKYNTI